MKNLGLIIIIGLGLWALTSKTKPVAAAVITPATKPPVLPLVDPSLPAITPNVPVGPTTVQVAGGAPVVVPVSTPQTVITAIVAAIEADSSVDKIQVVNPATGTDYTIDVASVVQAAAIEGKSQEAWLLEYAYGIAPAPAPVVATPVEVPYYWYGPRMP